MLQINTTVAVTFSHSKLHSLIKFLYTYIFDAKLRVRVEGSCFHVHTVNMAETEKPSGNLHQSNVHLFTDNSKAKKPVISADYI